jgi:hypothetical protein
LEDNDNENAWLLGEHMHMENPSKVIAEGGDDAGNNRNIERKKINQVYLPFYAKEENLLSTLLLHFFLSLFLQICEF